MQYKTCMAWELFFSLYNIDDKTKEAEIAVVHPRNTYFHVFSMQHRDVVLLYIVAMVRWHLLSRQVTIGGDVYDVGQAKRQGSFLSNRSYILARINCSLKSAQHETFQLCSWLSSLARCFPSTPSLLPWQFREATPNYYPILLFPRGIVAKDLL